MTAPLPQPPAVATIGRPLGTPAAVGRRLVVGIGEYAVSNGPDDVIVTHALGSCVAVCIYDPVIHVAGLIHVLLPESKINPQRAVDQPAAFADTGIPLLLQAATNYGFQKKRATVKLAGGAEISNPGSAGAFNIGRRNILSVKNVLWKHGLLIRAESIGGTLVRTVHLVVRTGGSRILSNTNVVEEL